MPITSCAVTGTVKNLIGANVQGCKITVSTLKPFFHSAGPAWISGEIGTTTTAADGTFSLDVIETETPGIKLTFTFDYADGANGRGQTKYSVVVPDEDTASLQDLINAAENPVTSNTFPAASVTVNPTGNQSASNAQDAIDELQTDIDTRATSAALTAEATARALADTTHAALTDAHGSTSLNTASAIVQRDASGNFAATAVTANLIGAVTGNVTGNVSGTAATFTGSLTGDVTSTGMSTAIAAGVIVNADVNASAAIERSKLATGTAYGVVVNDSSGVMTSVAPGTTGNVLKSDGTSWASGTLSSTYIAPTVQRLTSGTSATYTRPTNPTPIYLKIRMLGGGAGGAGGSSSSTNNGGSSGAGGETNFKTAADVYILTAGGGAASVTRTPGAGGSVTVASPAVDVASRTGSSGAGGGYETASANYAIGGHGGVSPLGGAGKGEINGVGTAAVANTGSGGGGGSGGNTGASEGGGGGSAGGYVEAIIASPAATYLYTIGAGGAGGTATGTGNNGAAGGSGVIIVEEHYQ